ncbi:MAG: hypothetical protein WCD72_04615, partial [Dehalococcoidia bacterium]
AVMFIAGCTGGPITITGPSQLPAINSFNASPASISAGESSSLSWTVTGATTVSIDQGIGNVALTGTRGVVPAATTIYTLTASSAAGSITATTQVIVTGATPPTPTSLPVINSFTASPSSISLGGSTSLSWNVSNATSVTIDNGVGAVGSSGNTIVLPTATTVFTLTASNAAGSDTATALVIVSGVPSPPASLPVINYFTASPPIISGGGSTTLSWNVSDASAVSIDNGIGPVGSAGTTIVSPASSINYTLTATNAAGWRTMTLAVLVTGGGGPTVAYDFVEQAPTAYWWTKVGASMVALPFPGALNDNRGFATYRYNVQLNDGNTYTRVLETHPQWVNNGWISGKYSGVYVPPGAKLRIKVGLINGAGAGNVEFYIGKLGDVATISLNVAYADGVQVREANLSAYAGQTIDFVVGTNANGSSGQDWAAWAEAKIIY